MAEEMVVSVPLMEFLENEVKDRVAQKEWMKNRTFKRAENMEEVMVYVDEAIAAGRCALDLETTGLSTRVRYVEGEKVPVNKIIGFCLCYDSSFGIYIPINHVESDGSQDKPSQYNLPEEHVFPEMQRLCSNCITIYHNAKFDIAFLNNHGITIGNHKDYDDTMLLAYMFDSGQKDIGLKNLSARMLNQPMLELTDMTGDKKSHRLELICPTVAYIYGASDAICTLDLYNYLIEQDIVKAQSVVYALEKRVVIVLIEMEGNLVKIDKPYLEEMQKKGEERLESIIKEIYELAGKEFNIGSPVQLGKILFEDLGYTYPVKTKTASGQYLTNNITLEKIADQYPVVNKIVRFRKLSKMLGTYINNLLINCDEEDCVKLNFKQTGTDTGRFSSPGGRGLLVDGLAGVNVQAIPKMPPKDNADMNLRDAFVARPGTTMVAIDYANEEMRVATNLAHETTWINAIRDGVDFHTATAAIIAGKEPKDVLKAERKIGKTVNFLALYLGGPMTLSAQAKVTVPEAKKILATYFAGVPHLRKWIDTEIIKARKRKFVKTVFGRTRLLNRFYGSGDRGLESHGDRCAINTQIQGCLQSHERCLTTDGYLSIIEIKRLKESGKDLRVWTGTTWETFDVIDRGKAQLSVIELKNGMKIDADTRHEVLTVGKEGYEFKKFKELTKDTKICVSLPRLLEFGNYPKDFSYEGGSWNDRKLLISTDKEWSFISYLMGCVIGDGYMYINEEQKKYCIELNFGEEKVKEVYPYIKENIESIGLNISEPKRSKGSIGIAYVIRIHSIAIVRLFQNFGYRFKNAKDKRVPQQIMGSPIEMRKSFLRGYYDTDGCKKEENKYSFHTPNKDLLRDLQLLAWTLGCPSNIYECGDGSYMLNWLDFRRFGSLFGLVSVTKKYNGPLMSLPDFLRKPVLDSLGKCYVKNSNDTAYVYKIRNGMSVGMPGIYNLLEDYKCDLPEMYYFSELKDLRVLNKEDSTYTLSVHSPLHRFDSAGIISKNTSADIMKAVMSKLYHWIHRNNLQDEIKTLITMHDELVFEIPTEKLELYVPEIAKIMMLKEVIIDRLKWTVPLTVDVQYGRTWRTGKDFFADFPGTEARLNEPLMEFAPQEKKAESVSKEESTEQEEKPEEKVTIETPSVETAPQDIETEEKDIKKVQEDSPPEVPIEGPVLQNIVPSLSMESEGVFIYELKDRRKVTLRWLNDILNYLIEESAQISENNKQTLKIKDHEGNSLLISEFKLNIESFQVLVKFFGI